MSMNDPLRIPPRYGFNDLRGFVDYFARVSLLDEEDFDPPDFVPAEWRWTVDDVFHGLGLGYRMAENQTGATGLLKECRRLTAEARALFHQRRYEEGRDRLSDALRRIESLAV